MLKVLASTLAVNLYYLVDLRSGYNYDLTAMRLAFVCSSTTAWQIDVIYDVIYGWKGIFFHSFLSV